MFQFFKKKPVNKSTGIEIKKNYMSAGAVRRAMAYAGTDNKLVDAKKALYYYDVVSPVATAIDLINDEFKNLTLVIDNGDEIVNKADILNFLKQPNDDMVQADFLETLGVYFLAANEVYIVATGAINRPPAELLVISPEQVDVKRNKDGFIGRIEVQKEGGGKEIFERSETKFRFYNKEDDAEIWQIKGFNSKQTGRGRSKLNSVAYEVEQYLQCAIHNLALLENGVRASGAFVADGDLSEEQFLRLKQEADEKYSGSLNAGKPMVLEGGMKWLEMSINPKDMDFPTLKKGVMSSIFTRYKIPEALVSTEHMARATMEESKLNLYDNAVLPFANRMFAEITAFLAPRFNMKENELIIPNLDDITALEIRRTKALKNKKELGVLTINEMREEIGEGRIVEGGDIVYIPGNLIPAGTSVEQNSDQDENTEPPEERTPTSPTDAEEAKTTREGFIKILKSQVDVKGNRSFNDKDIERIADEEGL